MRIELSDNEKSKDSKRRFARRKRDSKRVTLWDDSGQPVLGEVLDESFGGIGLRFDANYPFKSGQEIHMSYNGIKLCAVVRHVTPGGTRKNHVGLEWKASGLSAAARESLMEESVVFSRSPGAELSRFKEALPSGLYVMWRFFDAEMWFELAEKAKSLHKLARECEVADTLTRWVEEMQAAVECDAPKEPCRQALQSLIRECIQVTGGECHELV